MRQNGSRWMLNVTGSRKGSALQVVPPFGFSCCFPITFPKNVQATVAWDTPNKYLELFPWSRAIYEPDYPCSPAGSSGTQSRGLSLMDPCECQDTRAVNPPERNQSKKTPTLIGGAHVRKWQIMTYKWEFMWPLDMPADPGRDGEGVY